MPDGVRVHLIACGVLRLDADALAERLGVTITTDYLEGGLHADPGELRRQLQDAIDRASDSGTCDRIAIGYGLCGRGTVGLRSRNLPLAIPRVHDCISLFLGSDAAYRREFASCPGTFYTSAGWFEEKVQPHAKRQPSKAKSPLPAADREALIRKYGAENGEAIADFLTSWQRNYQRSAFINTGAGNADRYESYARALAREFGWKYTELPGDLTLLEQLICAWPGAPGLVWVPPHHITHYDGRRQGLVAAPLWQDDRPEDEAEDAPDATPAAIAAARRRRYGLGIDAGGTYTDAVIYDFAETRVLCRGKALTTRWDYTVGIRNAMDVLDADLLRRVELVAVSTTLATNAIVEGYGQPVGLLLMPPFALEPDVIPHAPKACIRGRLDIRGEEREPVDDAEVIAAARAMVATQQVRIFAVSGYASTVNPVHELHVKRLLTEHFDLPVCCGHELSDQLNFRVRANTAVLNARIIPLLTMFLEDAREALTAAGIAAPMMVVKGDGSLMSESLAAARPVETVLSGPAASVAGARHLTGLTEALVVDIGGTTSDLARVRAGRVDVCPEGASVGGWRTHVRALDMRTVGFGGDSAILWEKQVLLLGPQRVAPIAWLAAQHDLGGPLDHLARYADGFRVSSRPMQFFWRSGRRPDFPPTEREQHILDALAEAPLSLHELALRVGLPHWGLLDTDRLEREALILRCGLTPTDLLHASGQLALWDRAAATRMAELTAALMDLDVPALIDRILAQAHRRLTAELLKKQLDRDLDAESIETCPACNYLLDSLLADDAAADLRFSLKLAHPVIGLGAPVGYFLPPAATALGAELIVPPDADVANAVGAITSWVTVRKSVRILPNDSGAYDVQGLAEQRSFQEFDAATEWALDGLKTEIVRLAREAGTNADQPRIEIDDQVVAAADGTEVFLGRRLHAEISGVPDAV